MLQVVRTAVAIALIFVVAGCGAATISSAPATSASSAAPVSAEPSSQAASVEPSVAPASLGAGGASAGAACAASPAGTAPTVTVTIKNFAFSPEPVTAKVGDVIGWTNSDSIGHTATLDDGTCTTDIINNGQTQSLTFSAPGTYPYHCSVHPAQMKGTITVS
jgi:plastocyanin